jgi:hypothetical protein
MSRKTFMLRVRLTAKQERKLKWAAIQKDKDMSEVVRDYISKLPEPPDQWDESSYPEMSGE